MATSKLTPAAMLRNVAALRINQNQGRNRQGSVTVLSLALTTVLVTVLAITLDLGYISVSQSELRRTADASAMAACWELFDQQNSSSNISESSVLYAAMETASLNLISQQSPTIGTSIDDFAIGHYDPKDGGLFSSNSTNGVNAVRVRIARESVVNGELPLFFGAITGRQAQSLETHSVAAMLNNISGFYAPATDNDAIDILPIALDLETWELVIAGQTSDSFACEDGTVSSGSDGKFECNLYPQGTGSPGNRGTVDIGDANNSTADLSRQILHGISREDFVDLGKPLAFDVNGILELNGDTGISAGIKDELASIIGQKRIIPIYTNVSGNGNNAIYRIVRLEGFQILDVKLTGPKNGKRVIVQPAKMVARNAILSTSESHSSDYLVTPVMLVE